MQWIALPKVWFMQINYLPQLSSSANIIDLRATDKSRYFAQPLPIIANYYITYLAKEAIKRNSKVRESHHCYYQCNHIYSCCTVSCIKSKRTLITCTCPYKTPCFIVHQTWVKCYQRKLGSIQSITRFIEMLNASGKNRSLLKTELQNPRWIVNISWTWTPWKSRILKPKKRVLIESPLRPGSDSKKRPQHEKILR